MLPLNAQEGSGATRSCCAWNEFDPKQLRGVPNGAAVPLSLSAGCVTTPSKRHFGRFLLENISRFGSTTRGEGG